MSRIVYRSIVTLAIAVTTMLAWSTPGQAEPPAAAGLASQVAALQQQVNTLQQQLNSLLQYVTIVTGSINGLAGPHLIFTGVNVHVRSGSGATEAAGVSTALGNLVVGYNEEPLGLAAGDRGGAHNLVVGPLHRYRSVGGFVAGVRNTVGGSTTHGRFSSVTGGVDNIVTGDWSSVSGGGNNTASGSTSSVSGGSSNTASGSVASISGGEHNTASGVNSSVNGGVSNTASGGAATVSGGSTRSAAGLYDWVAGGLFQDD